MTHWDEYTFDRKLRAFEAIGFAQGEAVKLADVSWDNFTSEVKRALKESDDTFFGTGIDDDKEYTDEEIEAENKKKEETGESYDYNNIGTNELQRTKYQCEFCNSGYKSNESLSVHLNDVHTQTLGEINGYGLSGEESSYYKRAKESDERCSDCGDLEDLDEYGKCSYCHEESLESKAKETYLACKICGWDGDVKDGTNSCPNCGYKDQFGTDHLYTEALSNVDSETYTHGKAPDCSCGHDKGLHGDYVDRFGSVCNGTQQHNKNGDDLNCYCANFISGESYSRETKIAQGDLYQGGQKVGTIRDYNSKQHEGYVTLDGIGIEEFGAMTSDYEVKVNGERIPNKWDGKHDYNLDLFGEAESPSAVGEDSETVDVFDLVHETRATEKGGYSDTCPECGAWNSFGDIDDAGQYECKDCGKQFSTESRANEDFDVYDIKGGDLVAFRDPSAERGIFAVVEDNGDNVVIKSMSGGSTQTVSRGELLNASQDSPELARASGESIANEIDDTELIYWWDDMHPADKENIQVQFPEIDTFSTNPSEIRKAYDYHKEMTDESYAREDDPDFENDPDFEGKIGGKSVEPSQYTQSGMDHEDRSRGDIDFDGEAVRSCPACNYANDGRSLSCTSCGQDFPSNEEPSIQAQETITTAFGNGMVYHTSTAGGTIEHPEDEWCTSCDDAHESKAKEYDTKTNVWGSTSRAHVEKDIEENFEDTHEDFHDGLMDYSNTCKICGEHIRQYDSWKKEKLQDHLLQAHGDMHGMESKADPNEYPDDSEGHIDAEGNTIWEEDRTANELYGQNDPDEILGGSWGTPENTANDLYNMMPHNYDREDYFKYESMILDKIGSASNGQFSANALSLFLRNKGVTSDDLINDLVMEYGKGTDPIW